jgi:hypothetical protein
MLARHESEGTVWYSFEALDKLGFLENWITTRRGGVSRYGFNLGGHVGDDGNKVEENLRRAARLLSGGRPIYMPVQVHGCEVHEPSESAEARSNADAVFIKKPFLPAGVLTADCLPLILADTAGKTATVIHAGRKGIFGNIIARAIRRMGGAPAGIVAALGPAIRSCCYEVKDDVFEGGFDAFRKYFAGGRLDIIRAARDQLLAAGVSGGNIHDCGICTCCHTDEFYSHRGEEGKTGRFLTGAMVRDV